MTLKKFLKNKGQASLEYVILFSIIAVLTIVSLSTFYPKMKASMVGDKGFFQTVVERIIQ